MINTNEILNKYRLKLTKSLGQNFLTDINILKKIADAGDLTQEDLVLEIGPGIGALTVVMAQKAGSVIAVELDKNLMPALKFTTGSYKNITIINDDILKVNVNALIGSWKGPVKIISNLPYYVTTPVIMMFLENNLPIERMVIMVQKEVAQRMSASPGTKEYGALSVGVQAAGDVKSLFNVSCNCFIPKPDVDSSVVRIMIHDKYQKMINDRQVFLNCVKAAFLKRRKTLINAMSSYPELNLKREKVKEIIAAMKLKETIRGEELSVEQFIQLANLVSDF
ncbi:MAG: 16S rRNA (adenine(1518)-N(6)/adenine(1519)-N(6))-dimethyltransferase RsmA [Clostridiaceae bacterium]|nr:16S rRNA (adenine(1518)-N(6)/adenine(1519)-N(6))-dimethyltransferase RsmA [Clostridiaceae bacterium]